MTRSSRCATPTTRPGKLEFDAYTLNWLEETGGIVDTVDKNGNKSGDCVTAIAPLISALEALCPHASTIAEYAECLREITDLGRLSVFLKAVREAKPAQKEQLKAVMAECVLSEDAHNTIGLGSDGGLFENETI